MQRSLTATIALLAASTVLSGSAMAQQTPATTSKPATSAKAPSTTTTKSHVATTAKKPRPLVLETQKDKASYAIGLNIGKSMHRDDVDVDPKIVAQGLADALAGNKPLLTDEEIKTNAIAVYQVADDLYMHERYRMDGVAKTTRPIIGTNAPPSKK